MKKLIENWPLEFWSAEAFGGLIVVAMLVFAVLMITRTIDEGIQSAGYEYKPKPLPAPAVEP